MGAGSRPLATTPAVTAPMTRPASQLFLFGGLSGDTDVEVGLGAVVAVEAEALLE